jgi:hypothetical protein
MKSKYGMGIFFVIVLSLAAACKTTPPAPPAESLSDTPRVVVSDPNAAPADQASLDALDAARARAENARKQAQNLEGQNYFPEDWNAAETGYRAAGEGPASTVGEARDTAAKYAATAAAYDEIARKSLPLYAWAREVEIIQARTDAINAGIEEVSPERLAAADAVVREAQLLYEGENYYAAADEAFRAVDSFRALAAGAVAYKTWQEIENYDFGKYNRGDYVLVEQAGLQAVEDYDGGRFAEARREAEEVMRRLDRILYTGWESFAVERKAAADRERQAALGLKANVAVRNEFNAALAVYNQGESSIRARNYDIAANMYAQSESMFSLAKTSAELKRRAAEEAVKAAEQKLVESDTAAQNAEKILEGGTR